jgi:hypothetical protein
MCLQDILIKSPLNHPPSFSLPSLEQLRQVSLLYFFRYTKYNHNFCPLYSLCLLSPRHWYPPLDGICFIFLSFIFLKCILIVWGGISQLYILTLVRWAPLLLTLSLTIPLLFNSYSAFPYIIFLYQCIVFQYYSLSIILSSSPTK